jgi:hypothetical protein
MVGLPAVHLVFLLCIATGSCVDSAI